jgi:serine/threonine-protein kinase
MAALMRRIKHIYRSLVDRPYAKHSIIAKQYNIQSILGMGSFGIIYLCEDQKTSTECVLKQMRPSKRQNKDIHSMYHDEADILGSLEHHGIPKLLRTFIFDQHFFFAMEYIDGTNLEDILFHDNYRFSEKEALQLLDRLLNIIEYLHSQEVVHGDIRIPNVMITSHQLYLIDFGLAVSLKNKTGNQITKLIQSDFYDLGDFLLYLLYSSYDTVSKKDKPWKEELNIQNRTEQLINRLLNIESPYPHIQALRQDLHQAIAKFY